MDDLTFNKWVGDVQQSMHLHQFALICTYSEYIKHKFK